MTDTFRALCAELTEKLDELNCLYKVPSQSALIERALDALAEADEPAVPDGREPAEEWQTGLPSSPGFYYVRDLLDESIGGDNRPVYVNPKHFVWGFWEQDDPEWIGLDSDITPENIQWKPVAPPLAPPAAVTVQPGDEELLQRMALPEVAELVEWLRHEAESQHPGSGEALPSDVRDELLNAFTQLTRAAELLQRMALPEVGE